MTKGVLTLQETPSQTAGPYVHIGCIPSFAGVTGVYPTDLGRSAIAQGAKGERISITGRILDGMGAPLKDAMLESWQADANGLYPGQVGADPCVTGFCRFAADKDSGIFTLNTILPGSTPHPSGEVQAPHIALWIVARGINIGLQTRIYFQDQDNSADPLLQRIEHEARRETLIAHKTAHAKTQGQYRFDIHLQGPQETVFLDM